MTPDDGGQSPVKRGKGRSPDIERALANWARKEVGFVCYHAPPSDQCA